jgi:hypothetical protein
MKSLPRIALNPALWSPLLLALAACGGAFGDSASDSSVGGVIGSAFATLGGALDNAEGTSFKKFHPQSSCDAIGPSCANGAATWTFNGCTSTRESSTTLEGALVGNYDNDLFCTAPLNAGTTLTLTSDDFRRVLGDGSYEEVMTSSVNSFQGQAWGGGIEIQNATSGGSTVYEITILGVTRRLINSSHSESYEHIVHQDDLPLTSSGTRASGDRGVSGVFDADHNSSDFSIRMTLSNLRWSSATCCHPTDGSVSIEYGGNKSGTATLSFDGSCGHASLDNSDGTNESVTLESCL